MMKKLIIALLIGMLLLVACDTQEPTPSPAAEEERPTPTAEIIEEPNEEPTIVEETPVVASEGVFISEVLAGVPGGNNDEYITLYNAGSQAVDMDGWSLWYLLGEGQEPALVFEWNGRNDIPPHGHILLVREERDFGLIPDGFFDVSLSEFKGGLALRDADGNVVDSLGWGDAPAEYVVGTAVEAPALGTVLRRLPGGQLGQGRNSGDNSVDFVLADNPQPKNSGSPAVPPLGGQLAVRMLFPEAVAPGEAFDYTVEITNLGDTAVTNTTVAVPIPEGFTLDGEAVDGFLEMPAVDIPSGGVVTVSVELVSPLTFTELPIRGYYVETSDGIRSYGGPQILVVGGGAIPIATARTLVGSTVTVEGVATMYSGAFFAGSSSVKFYIQDETGGIQIFADGGNGIVEVDVGDVVRVTGRLEYFRDSLELIPGDPNTDVEIVGTAEVPEPTPIAITENENDDNVLGELNVIEGVALSIVDGSFDYQIEVADDQGNSTLVLIEKDTGVTAELLNVGDRYQFVGISEFYQGEKQVKPRFQEDITQIFPPVLLVEVTGKNNLTPNETGLTTAPYTITVYNYTSEPMTNIVITGPEGFPVIGSTLDEVLNQTAALGDEVKWEFDELEANGGSETSQYTYLFQFEELDPDGTGIIQFGPFSVTSDQWTDPVTTEPYLTFVGRGVPIWAIQGNGATSPYVRADVTTEGIVTAVFPDLNGFWIQETETDDDPATSAGVFILMNTFRIDPVVGDRVEVTGRVRELFSQTLLDVDNINDVVILESGLELPEPVFIDPPQDNAEADAYKESLEGMLVTLGEPAVVVAPTSRFGEYVLVYERWGVEHVARTEPSGFFIMVDDGATIAHNDVSTMDYFVKSGDIVTNLTGPLTFSFGQYKIEPVGVPEIEVVERPLPELPLDGDSTLSVATFNVENLFDLVDPHPSSPPRPTLDEYRLKLTKIAATIIAMGAPDIIGLQEIENIGVLEDLVEEPILAEFGYEPYLIEGDDSRGIDVAYLVRSDSVTVEGVNSYPGPNSLTSRHPLVLTATVHLESGDRTVYVLNNHFLALSAGEAATEPARTNQAVWNVELIEQIRENDPEASIIVLGDLNSFYQTPPIDTLQAAGLRHIFEFTGNDPLPYTYIFEGLTQSLDHILMTADLYDGLTLAQAMHFNADYPIWSLEDSSPQHVSDHDPLVVVIGFDS